MISYEQVPGQVRAAYQESHQRFWDRLAAPGAWWTGAERVDIAREARHAADCAYCRERKAALSPYYAVSGTHEAATDLDPVVVEVVHVVMTDARRLTRRWYESVLERGLGAEAYVEIVGTVVALVSVDGFCRGVGSSRHALPEPRTGEPSGYRPPSAGPDQGWVPMVPADNAATAEADLWAPGRAGNVVRAMSVVH